MKNSFILNYDKKTLVIFFEGQEFPFDLNDGDIGDFWNSLTTKDGINKDVNFSQENKDEKPCVTVYEIIDGSFVNTNNGISIPKDNIIGNPDNYFGIDAFAECEKIYSKDGQSGVFDHVKAQWYHNNPAYRNVIYMKCKQCEIESPSLNGTCLVCGSDVVEQVPVELILIHDSNGILENQHILSGVNRKDIAHKIIRDQMKEWGYKLPLDISNDDITNVCFEMLDSSGREIRWEISGITECP